MFTGDIQKDTLFVGLYATIEELRAANAEQDNGFKDRHTVVRWCFTKGDRLMHIQSFLAEVTLHEQDLSGAGCQGALQRVA